MGSGSVSDEGKDMLRGIDIALAAIFVRVVHQHSVLNRKVSSTLIVGESNEQRCKKDYFVQSYRCLKL